MALGVSPTGPFFITMNFQFLLVDEHGPVPHSAACMSIKHFIRVFVLGGVVTTATATEIPAGPVTLEQCLKVALENNLDIRISQYLPTLAEQTLKGAYAAYDPAFRLGGTDSFRETKGRINPLEFTSPTSETDSARYNVGLGGNIPTGLRYNLGLNFSESIGTSQNNDFSSYGANLGMSLTQPLLKNAWIDGPRMQIRMSRSNLRSSELDVIQRVMTTVSSVEIAYYQLITARENINVAEEDFKMSQETLARVRKEIDAGASAEIEIFQPQAALASSQASLISVRNTYANRVNALKALLTDDFAAIQDRELNPAEGLNAVSTVFNRADSWDKALTKRPDILKNQLELDRSNIRLKYSKNQLYPQLDLTGTFGWSGSDSSLNIPIYGELDRPKIESEAVTLPNGNTYAIDRIYPNVPQRGVIGSRRRDGEFSRAIRDVRRGDYPNYSIGLQLVIPIPNRGARSNYNSTKAQHEQMILNHKRIEQQIMVQIDDLIRQAENSLQRIEATRQARISAEKALEAEESRREAGASTYYQVNLMQRDMTRSRYQENSAMADYLMALTRLSLDEGSILDKHGLSVEFE